MFSARPRLSAVLLVLALLPGCGEGDEGVAGGGRRLVVGLVAKSQSNPVFQAAYAGAQAAAAELGADRDLEIVVDWQTPPDEDPLAQAAAIEQLARAGVAGIAVSCSDANTVTPAIDKAVELGADVVCFDSDAPDSDRFLFYGTDDVTCGRRVMAELAAALGGEGIIAVLAGNQAAPNLQKRVDGVLAELDEHPGISLLEDGIVYHAEVPERAAEAVAAMQSTHPEIDGWAFVGGWPLYTRGGLRWEPGTVKVVSVDALPAQLTYLESGHVELLLAQDCLGWGYTAVDAIVRRALGEEAPSGRVVDPLRVVRVEDVETEAALWREVLGGG